MEAEHLTDECVNQSIFTFKQRVLKKIVMNLRENGKVFFKAGSSRLSVTPPGGLEGLDS